MRALSFRSLFLVLAVIVQIAAGGTGFAGTSTGQAGVSAPCAQGESGDHKAPIGHHKHDCLSCQFCAGAASALPDLGASDYLLAYRQGARVGFEPERGAAFATQSERAHQPRAPPLA